MLDRCCDDAGERRSPRCTCEWVFDDHVIGFAAGACEDDLVGMGSDEA